MELIANTGKGYRSAEKKKQEDAPLGLIAIDSLFSPVKKFHIISKMLERENLWIMIN